MMGLGWGRGMEEGGWQMVFREDGEREANEER